MKSDSVIQLFEERTDFLLFINIKWDGYSIVLITDANLSSLTRAISMLYLNYLSRRFVIMQERILFGTYTKKTSQGIYVGTLDTTANTLNFKESSNESLSSGLLFGELVKLLSGYEVPFTL